MLGIYLEILCFVSVCACVQDVCLKIDILYEFTLK